MIIILVILGISFIVLGHELGHFLTAKFLKLKIEEFGFGLPPRIFGIQRVERKIVKKVGEEDVVKVSLNEYESVSVDEGIVKEVIKEEIIEEKKEIDKIVSEKKWRFFWGKKEITSELRDESEKIGTVYSLNWLPFGGFVKIAGENDGSKEDFKKLESLNDNEKEQLFLFQPAWRRALITVAGVFFNFLIGWVLFSGVLMIGTPPAVVVSSVQPDSPAEKVGILSGDIIRNYVKVDDFIKFVNNNRGKTIKITVSRNGKEIDFEAVPRLQTKKEEGALGVVLGEAGLPKQKFLSAIAGGLNQVYIVSYMTLTAFYKLIINLFVSGSLLAGVVGPIGIFGVAETTGSLGLAYLFELIALISINLAVINLIPFPALDGGRLFMILIEKIKGSRISFKTEAAINGVGFIFLIILMVLITIRDVTNLF